MYIYIGRGGDLDYLKEKKGTWESCKKMLVNVEWRDP